MQTDLFGNVIAPPSTDKPKKASKEPVELVTTWSFSRLDTMKQCSRKYYYQYFGSKKSKAKDDPFKERLIFLDGLQNKYLVIGDIIHHVIKTYFQKARVGDVWTTDRLVSWGTKRFRDAVIYSQQYVKNPTDLPVSAYPPALLKEIVLDEECADALLAEGVEKITTCLTNFGQSTVFAPLRVAGLGPEALLEKKAQFKFGQHIKVSGVIDITFPVEQQWIIADWKTGKAEIQETSLQLLAYAWWAIQTQGVTANQLVIQKAYLLVNQLEKLDFSSIHLERAKARIIQDSELLNHYDPFGVAGTYQVFSKISHQKVCDLCPYQSVCVQSD